MKTRIKCDVCDWKEYGRIPAWYFSRCPKCGARVINVRDLFIYAVCLFVSALSRTVLFFNPEAKTVMVHIDTKQEGEK